MATAQVYSVRAGPSITRIRPQMTRRRAGVEFGARPRLVSTQGSPGVIEVDDEQLEAILEDEHLNHKEVDRPGAESEEDTSGSSESGSEWELKMAPDEYLTRYPEGKHADLARELTSEAETTEETSSDASNGEEKGEEVAEEAAEDDVEDDGGSGWPLRMEPEKYLSEHPEGKHADLAREILEE